MSYDAVFSCMNEFVEMEDIVIYPYPDRPYGIQIIDQEGDFIIFFFDVKIEQVVCIFKDAEEFWFRT
ncbi:hypothetical protein [Virgibacillus doumboii]|uniref:hypothetical protein n=1 Tax=Virgibacillus doumboii TaxID=2697503 RepID=UPI0013DF6D26|nr:hypothetical protein [Virgibacillus doumboii]